jgi:hypothetical protein
MEPLVQMIKSDDQNRLNIDEVGLDKFQSEILAILTQFISAPAIKPEDEQIIKKCLRLWISCLSSEPRLMNSVITQKDDKTKGFVSVMIEKGLICSQYKVRDAFQ